MVTTWGASVGNCWNNGAKEKFDVEGVLTDEIEKALWRLKDDLDLPTEEIEMAVDSRKKLKGEKNGRTI